MPKFYLNFIAKGLGFYLFILKNYLRPKVKNEEAFFFNFFPSKSTHKNYRNVN